MASAPSNPSPVLGRVDRDGRLIAADAPLAALQSDAGSRVGDELALPQIAAIVRLALRLGVPVARPAIAASADQDVEMWVRAVPEGDEVALSIERWSVVPARSPRLASLVARETEAAAPETARGWATDAELRLIEIAPALARQLRIDPATAIGQPLTRLFKLGEDDHGEMPLLAAVASRGSFAGQSATTRSGEPISLTLSGEAMTGPDGRFIGFKGSADVELAAAAALEIPSGIDKMLDEALRSPIDQIIASADRIAERSDGPLRSDYAAYAGDISAAARHLLSVIRAMGEEPGGSREQLDLADLAEEAAGLLESAAEAKSITLHVEPYGALMAFGEKRGAVQILVNLIGNAVRHSPEGRDVAVSFECAANLATVHISDSGPGIDPQDQQRIFERFEQAQGAAGGSGLGLAISRRLARSMGGDIELVSAPGHGARFSLSLPAVN